MNAHDWSELARNVGSWLSGRGWVKAAIHAVDVIEFFGGLSLRVKLAVTAILALALSMSGALVVVALVYFPKLTVAALTIVAAAILLGVAWKSGWQPPVDVFGRSLAAAGIYILVAAVIAICTWLIAVYLNGYLAFAFLLGAVGYIVYDGIVVIPSDPPEIGILTVLGQRTKTTLSEGIWPLLLSPWVVGHIPLPAGKQEKDFEPVQVILPDKSRVDFVLSMTWHVVDPHQYVQVGQKKNAEDIAADIIVERLREWAASKTEGPQNWQDAQASQKDGVAKLAKQVFGSELTDDELASLRNGTSHLRLNSLGIAIDRLNITSVKPSEKIANAAEEIAIETEQRASEATDAGTFAANIKSLADTASVKPEQAAILLAAHRKDATYQVNELRTSGEGGVLENLAAALIAALQGKGKLAEKGGSR